MSISADLIIYNTSQLVTMAGNGHPKSGVQMSDPGIITNGAAASKNGYIVWIGPEKELKSAVKIQSDTCEIDAQGCAVIPGLVDPHTHFVFAGTREDEFAEKIAGIPYMEIAAKGGGIKRTVKSTRLADEIDLFKQAKLRLKDTLSFGITSMEIKSGYGLNKHSEFKMLRAALKIAAETPLEITTTFLGAHEIPPDRNKLDYLDEVCEEMIPEVSRDGLAEFCDVFCEKGVYTIEDSHRVLTTGKKHGLKPKIHADQMTDSGGASLAAEVGAISADHLDYTSSHGMSALKKSGTIPVILPGAVFFLGLDQYPPVRKMIEHDLPVAMATDLNPGSCMSQNLAMIMTIACTQCRMTIPEALASTTINAAFAMDRGDTCGSIEPGKRADLVILDVDNYEMIPYHFGHNHFRHVFCLGKCMVHDFKVLLP